ncbi:MAG: thiamine biosynthesis protein ApbE [Marinilabiliales bacterium]|nr:MAG: thiamine biosynthesis protein ApbE [Marinilabiliales bacterium]
MLRPVFLFLALAPLLSFGQLKHKTEVLLLMGSRFEITPYSENESLLDSAIQIAINEIKRVESILSEWQENSKISEINKNAGIKPIEVSDELFGLIQRCIKVSDLTDGAFDISWAASRGIWRFDGSMTALPEPEIIEEMISLVNYKNIVLDKEKKTVFLKEKGMAIGLGAIGKGYAANRAKYVMQQAGIENGIVICGGDLITWGEPAEGKLWRIGIANPDNPSEAMAWFEVGPMAVVTSGDYEKFAMIDGKRYGHIIDPRTLYPVEGLRSVTIICPDAELADALATAVFVMGKINGMALINQLNGIECMMIDNEGNILSSDNLPINKYENGDKTEQHFIDIGTKKE